MLSLVQAPGQSTAVPDPEQIPRPTPDDLAAPMRDDVHVAEPGEPGMTPTPFIRMTVSAMPNSTATKTKAALPLGAVIQPLAATAEPVPIVEPGDCGVVRCRRCRTYVNPYVRFIDSGRRWKCNVCGLSNDVPSDYFCELDGEGRRRDRMQRPELSQGTVEFIAAAEYMVRPPQAPLFFFLIETSYNSISSGMLRCVAKALGDTLDNLPGGERTQVGIMTFDNTLHFYNMTGAMPQMLVNSEIDDKATNTDSLPMMPDALKVNLSEHKEKVSSLLEKLPSMFASSQCTEVALGPALKMAYHIVQSIGGKLMVFSSTRPTLGEGKLNNREGAKPAASKGKDGSKSGSLLLPENDFYKKFAVDASKQQVCIDVWSCASAYTDLAALGQLAKHTTGSVMHYPNFSDVTMGERLYGDIRHNLTREQGWEAVMRVRVSRGLRISAFHGHFFIRGTDLLALPNVDADKTFAVDIGHDDNTLPGDTCCMQAALLYTTSAGVRRIRVHTVELPVTSSLAALYDACDPDACVNLAGRVALDTALNSDLIKGAEKLQNQCLEMLRSYRSLCPPSVKTNATLLLPQTLRLFPLYTLGLMKSGLFAPEVKPDERSFLFNLFSTAPVPHTTALLHPRLLQVFPAQYPIPPTELPRLLPLSATSLNTGGVFLIEDGTSLVLWLGKDTPSDFLQQAFGWPQLEGVDASTLRLLPAEQAPMAAAVHALCDLLRRSRSGWLAVRVIKQGENDGGFVRALIEDQTRQMMSYNEFMAHSHRHIVGRAS